MTQNKWHYKRKVKGKWFFIKNLEKFYILTEKNEYNGACKFFVKV